IFLGAYVPGTGDEANGMTKETDPGVPAGFRDVLKPQIEPRLGLTYDLTGAATTVLHSSVGYFHQARLGGGSLGNLASNPPYIHNPIVYYNTLSNLFAPGVTLANRPATVEALETNYTTPSSVNWSAGVRREIGWGTAVDVTYSGYTAYNMEMYYDLNGVPDGARFTDLHPENRDPTAAATATPTAAALLAEFLRPYRGYQNIRVRGNFASGDYHSLQMQVNRRYIRGVQFGAAYTLQRARGTADEDPGHLVRPVLVGDPFASGGDPETGFFNTAAFARPTRGTYGATTPRNVVRKPGLINTNFAVFKNVNFGGSRAAQFRAEIYNLFNQVEFQDIDRTARFDANGVQINPNFGTAIGISNPTRPPRVVQLSVRLNF